MAGALIAIETISNYSENKKKPKAIVADLFKKAAKGVIHSAEQWTNFIQQEFARMKDELDCELTKEGSQTLATLTQKYIFFKLIGLNKTRFELLKEWIDMIWALLKGGENHKQGIQMILGQDSLFALLVNVLMLSPQSSKQIKSCIVSTTGIDAMDSQLNKVKMKVFKLFKVILQFFDESKMRVEKQGKTFVSSLDSILRMSISTVLHFCNNEEIDLPQSLSVTLLIAMKIGSC